MIQFSNNVINLINSNTASAFFILKITNIDGSVFKATTTHYHDVTMSDSIIYLSDDYIIAVDPPRLDSNVDRDQYKLTLADPSFLNIAAFDNILLGKTLELRLCFMDTFTNTILTNLNDTFVVYRGKVDGMTVTISTEEVGSAELVVTCASPMFSLEMSRGIYLSNDYIKSLDATDDCCSQLYQGSGSIVLRWGRA